VGAIRPLWCWYLALVASRGLERQSGQGGTGRPSARRGPRRAAYTRAVVARVAFGRASDLAENEAGYLSYRQGRRMLRRSAHLPLGALAVLVAGGGLTWAGFAGGVLFPIQYAGIILVAVTLSGYLLKRWWPVLADVMSGRVATVQGELRTGSTLGIVRRIYYCHVANTSFEVPASLFDAVEPGRCRCYYTPRTRRLLTVQPLDDGASGRPQQA
jgi:hypothetical protein